MALKFQLPSPKSVISTAASVAATAMLVRSVAKDLIPDELRCFVLAKFHDLLAAFSNELTLVIDEFDGLNCNQLFEAAELYISKLPTPTTKVYRAALPERETKIHVSPGHHEEISDTFCGFQLKWNLITETTQPRYVPTQDDYHSSTMVSEIRYLRLTFPKNHKEKVFNEYLPYVVERSKDIREEKKTLKIYTLKSERIHGPRVNPWQSVNLDHPATFQTLAMGEAMKNTIIADLERFVKRKEFYRKVGKAWKRGYLLFGPPGTGKSSLIAAMANYLNFDVYDLELTSIMNNSELRKLLISTANRSILVVEDIDASLDLSERGDKGEAEKVVMAQTLYYGRNQEPKVTLSGVLNFIDGLWSSCGDQRIIIFTTNHRDKLDQALLRPGRMDVHIHMSYCTGAGVRMLIRNYLDITDHPLAMQAEELVASTRVTPAQVGELLLKSDDPLVALEGLVKFLEEQRESQGDGDGNEDEIENGVPELGESGSSNTGDELGGELIKKVKDSSAADKMVDKDEAADVLVESGKENGIKSEENGIKSE